LPPGQGPAHPGGRPRPPGRRPRAPGRLAGAAQRVVAPPPRPARRAGGARRKGSGLAAPGGEPSREAADRLLAAVGLPPPVPSEFEGLGTVANLVARGLGIAIMPRLAVRAYGRRPGGRGVAAGPAPA